MALNTVLAVTVYDFESTGNNFVAKKLRAVPLPAEFVDITGETNINGSPDQRVYCYSKILYHQGGPGGILKEAYTAETVAALVARANS